MENSAVRFRENGLEMRLGSVCVAEKRGEVFRSARFKPHTILEPCFIFDVGDINHLLVEKLILPPKTLPY